MDNTEIIRLLHQVLANQVIIYKRIEDVEQKVKGGFRSASISSYVTELKREAEKVLKDASL